MTPLHDENDRLPAWGLRDEAYDDRLRRLGPPRKRDEFGDLVDDDEGRDKEPRRRRGKGGLRGHADRDFRASMMSQTEVGLRLAKHLSQSPLVNAGVLVTLAGYEVNDRGDTPGFPITRFLSRWGYTRERGVWKYDWCGVYKRPGARDILLNHAKEDGHILTRLATGRRMVVFVSRGALANKRGPEPNNQINQAIGRIMSWDGTMPDDLFAVCVPRSKRFRQLADERRGVEGFRRADLVILHVDRGGGFSGLPETLS